MANDIQAQTQTETFSPSIGGRLKSVREGLGQTRKDIAAQLRLGEAVIAMMEENKYPADLPITFIRGYIRAYGKLVGIPEAEIQIAIEPIKPVAQPVEQAQMSKPSTPITTSNYFMQFSTYIIVLTITGLAGAWWYSHSGSAPVVMSDNTSQAKPLAIPSNDIVTDAQTQISNDATIAPAATADQAAPPQPLAPALGAAIAETHTQQTDAVTSNAQTQQPAAEPKKTQASKKPAYLRHQQDDDEDDDA